MSAAHNAVSMNIPLGHPLAAWVLNLQPREPIPYVTVSVGDVKAELILVGSNGIHQIWDEGSRGILTTYLATEWRLR